MVKFKVKKGKKFFKGPRWNFLGLNRKRFYASVRFSDNCLYNITENVGQINKIIGHSYRLLPYYDKISGKIKPGHHKDSVRFGWRCVEDKIEILAYLYVNSARMHQSLLKVRPGSWVYLKISETSHNYEFKAITDGGDSSIAVFNKGEKKGFLKLFIYRLYPYFGGKVSAPHSMDIHIKYLKTFV